MRINVYASEEAEAAAAAAPAAASESYPAAAASRSIIPADTIRVSRLDICRGNMLDRLRAIEVRENKYFHEDGQEVSSVQLFTDILFAKDLDTILGDTELALLLDTMHTNKKKLCELVLAGHLGHINQSDLEIIVSNENTQAMLKGRRRADFDGRVVIRRAMEISAKLDAWRMMDGGDDDDIVSYINIVRSDSSSVHSALMKYLLLYLTNYLESAMGAIPARPDVDSASVCGPTSGADVVLSSAVSDKVTNLFIALYPSIRCCVVSKHFYSVCQYLESTHLMRLLSTPALDSSQYNNFAEYILWELHDSSKPGEEFLTGYLHLLCARLELIDLRFIVSTSIVPHFNSGCLYSKSIFILLFKLPLDLVVVIMMKPRFMKNMIWFMRNDQVLLGRFIDFLGSIPNDYFKHIIMIMTKSCSNVAYRSTLLEFFCYCSAPLSLSFLKLFSDRLNFYINRLLCYRFYIPCDSCFRYTPIMSLARDSVEKGIADNFMTLFYKLIPCDSAKDAGTHHSKLIELIPILAKDISSLYSFVSSAWLSSYIAYLDDPSKKILYKALAGHKTLLSKHVVSQSVATPTIFKPVLNSCVNQDGQTLLEKVMWYQRGFSTCSLAAGSLKRLKDRLEDMNIGNHSAEHITDLHL